MVRWEPITTAPKDAREILVRAQVKDSKGFFVAHWAHGGGEDQPCFGPGWFYWTGYDFTSVPGKVTHWTPILEGAP